MASNTRVVAYPNTFRDRVNVEIKDTSTELYQISVYDALGRIHYQAPVAAQQLSGTSQAIDLANRNLPAGAYFITVEATDFRKVIRVMKSD